MAELVLTAKGLSRRFGGLFANKDVSLDLHRGVLHAVLGPNGAGKSTLINLLSGDLPPTNGQILYRDQDISGWSPDKRSRAGIGRSYQRTNIFPAFTAFENCRLAAQSRAPRALRILSKAQGYADLAEAADRALEQAGLAERRDMVASTLSHGEQRQLEIAMVLATRPSVLLLDEPLAGMGSEESQAMVALLQKLSPDHAILLVEHDMDAVFAVADVITVMVAGQVLESGPPEQIRASIAVQEAYLGGGESDNE
ncbi:ABC transporter ATP-binding protein [Aromatoleum diolicum]|uniref:ATP-binding cassette domain-containing protein n=1 Tax=Aromatoleum diolicum TaxID=75796 RepID=A0ABX1QD89_9RHOO|nr:ABC transporter ATP-binding protein [Aromatoleum diolicum]NMG75462.1 ATP-binding cassette domain-containing protein [Aromatoleum diolicum]